MKCLKLNQTSIVYGTYFARDLENRKKYILQALFHIEITPLAPKIENRALFKKINIFSNFSHHFYYKLVRSF